MNKRVSMIVNAVKTGNIGFLIKRKLGFTNHMDDKKYIQKLYSVMVGEKIDFENPKKFNEKLQWLKLYDRNPLYTIMVDKYRVKEYVSQKIGKEYVVPLLGVWDDFDEIDFEELPMQFVLKCTHDSAGLIICKDKKNFDKNSAKEKLDKCLKRNFFYSGREWPYKDIKPKIIAEKYMEDVKLKELRDYKFFTFNGEPKVLYITQGRGNCEETVADFFDMEFNHLPFTIDHNMAKTLPEPPVNFELMKELARELSAGTPQLRVDFYEVNGQVYFGEHTFFHCGGFEKFHPEEWNYKFGEWIKLSNDGISSN